MQAQSDELEVFADQVAKFISVKKSIQIAAKDEVLLTAKGSYIKVNSAGIEQGTPATHIVYAATKAMLGPRSLDYGLPQFAGDYSLRYVLKSSSNLPIKNTPFVVLKEDGTKIIGHTDDNGLLDRVFTRKPETLDAYIGTYALKKLNEDKKFDTADLAHLLIKHTLSP